MVIAFDIKGNEHECKNCHEAIFTGREVIAYKSDLYYIMCAHDGELFNPFETGINIYKRDSSRGKFKYNFKVCSMNCFQFFIKYLGSRNKRFLRIAQRRFLDE